MARYYLMPIVGTSFRVAKHQDAICSAGYRVTIIDYGPEPVCIARVTPDPSTAVHNALIADVEVTAIPANLDNTINGNVSAVQSALDDLFIPSDWVDSSTTYRFILRRVIKYFLLMQKAASLAGDYVTRLFDNGRTLSTTINELPIGVRNRLSDAAAAMGLDTTGLDGSSTLGEVLRAVAEQLSDDLHIGFEL